MRSQGVPYRAQTVVGSQGVPYSAQTVVGSQGVLYSAKTVVGSQGVLYSAQTVVGSQGVPYSAQTWMVVCSQHFSEADFTSPECIRLNWLVSSDSSTTAEGNILFNQCQML